MLCLIGKDIGLNMSKPLHENLRALGNQVKVLADRAAEPFLVEQLQVQPVLPASIWHRMGDGAGARAGSRLENVSQLNQIFAA
jgi:hypothetical protein